ncbi:DUF7351 domain-containing protein [Haloarcula nitratireducens]|uniref:ArsR family transcriptional regulator n=1 Tax=Haloarcula nitratireducens TaxID=2487749 RepID=A0AAW4PCS5_9EURY|nr:hypothetical protein [Halomicroarcula nitratireducens]MBX0295613.1 hypothetical protein [Halomicroarcula nitratireducens]
MAEERQATLSPEEAFGLVGHELRISILRALGEAERQRLSFSVLRERVGERDSGKFNYHLSKLEGRFVAKTDDGLYALTYPGHRVVDAIQGGAFHRRDGRDSEPLSGSCIDCGGGLAFTYRTVEGGRVACRECGLRHLRHPFDPGGLVGRSGDEIGRAFDRVARSAWARAHAECCPVCSGHVARQFSDGPPAKAVAVRGHSVAVGYECQRCSYHSYVPPGAVLLTHPGVQGFCYENGVDLRERPVWELPFVVDPAAVTVRTTDPWEVAVRVAPGDAERVAVLDGTGAVTAFD